MDAAFLEVRHGGRSLPRRDAGMVLVAVLGLISVVLLLVTTLSLLTRVDTIVGSAQLRQSDARRHAWMAVELARAHLQAAAGPDRRTTATSALDGGRTHVQRGLTGVWSTAEAEPRLLTWLVSGNTPEQPFRVTPGTVPDPLGPAGADEVFLVDRVTVSRDEDRVKLPRMPLWLREGSDAGAPGAEPSAPRLAGHLAYWIGDEGVKASFGLAPGAPLPESEASESETIAVPGFAPAEAWGTDPWARMRLRQASSRGPRLDFLFPEVDLSSEPWASRVERVLSREQWMFVDPAISPSRARAAHGLLTPGSRAVLAHSSAGGLRHDLSDTPEVSDPALRLFLAERPLRFEDGRPVHRFQPATEGLREDGLEPAYVFSVGPVLTEYVLRLRLVRRPSDGRLGLGFETQAELWNPYSVALQAEPGELTIGVSGLPRIFLETASGDVVVDLDSVVSAGQLSSTEVWQPGEIRRFCGSVRLASTEAPGEWYPSSDLIPPGGDASTEVRLWTDAVGPEDSMRLDLRVRGERLSELRTELAFDSSAWSGAVGPTGTSWLLGYGFARRDDLAAWIDGSRPDARDPRWPRQQGNLHEVSAGRWTRRPSDNQGDVGAAPASNLDPSKRVVLFELPRHEVVSLGSLQHLITQRPAAWGNPWGERINQAFDRYFLSTVPRGRIFLPATARALPNPAMEIYWSGGCRAPDAGDPRLDAGGVLEGRDAGAYFLQRGAFNVNSVQPAAWRAMLSGIHLPGWRHGADHLRVTDLARAYFRFSQSAQDGPWGTDGPDEGTVAGAVRQLTEEARERLAESVVGEILSRGRPSSSLAEFLNAGILARALADSGVNAALAPGPSHRPGWITQADVATAIAPFLASRSDTFVVRAYGDRVDPLTGVTEARAWCEAVLQRVPELEVAPGIPPPTAMETREADEVRFPSGRRIVIASFRWLSESDL